MEQARSVQAKAIWCLRWNREGNARKPAEYSSVTDRIDRQRSHQAISDELRVPHSTLRYWLARQGEIDENPEVVAFLNRRQGCSFFTGWCGGAVRDEL